MFRAYTKFFALLYLLLLSITSSADINENKSACPAGDAYFLQYLALKDEVMRVEDYKNFYEPLKRLSQAGFCIHMNWSASVRDLKQALTNQRPTIIIWSSHGQPGGITNKDDDQFLLPPDIFKNISPSVFQIVVATCFGSLAIKNYDLLPAKQVKFTGWDFPLSTEYFRKFLEKWDFLENYPANYVHNKLSCRKSENQYQLITVPGGKLISSFSDQESCFNNWSTSAGGLVCAVGEERSMLFDIVAGKIIANSGYGKFSEWCLEVPEQIYNDRFCYMAEKKSTVYQGKQYYDSYYGIYDLVKHEMVPQKEFSQREDCTKFLWSDSPRMYAVPKLHK